MNVSIFSQSGQVSAKRKFTRSIRFGTVVKIFLLLLPYTVSFGDSGPKFTLINNTPYYLHAVIGGQPFLYITPYGRVIYEANSLAGFNAEVTYSPGQGVKGRAMKSISVEITTRSGQASTCSSTNTSSGNDCSSNTQATSTTTISAASWTVQQSDLQ